MANLYEILSYRQLSSRESKQRRIWSHLHSHESFVESLCYSCQLEGHRGCVNCLQWNTDGSLLASGSDDLTTILWDPYQKKAAATVQTGHTGNIFSVKFLPFSGDKHLLTGSEDGEVRLHDLTTFDTTRVWGCCRGRVKRIATSPQSPFYCWSASEDGCVRRLDTREPHTCSGSGMCRNVIIDLRAHSRLNSANHSIQCKCIDINPVQSEQIAVGALDPYARIYDTRLCSFQALNSLCSGPPGDPSCIACFSPGHMSKSYARPMKKHLCNTVAATYLAFSSDGQELLVNLSGEQVYLYDISNHLPPVSYDFDKSDSTSVPRLKPSVRSTRKHLQTMDGIGTKLLACVSEPSFIPGVGMEEVDVGKDVVKLRNIGKDLYKKEKLDESLQCFNTAISRCPNWYVLYFLRGTTLYSRKWNGDVYAALRDIETSLSLCPTHRLSKQRRIQCLIELGMKDEVFRFLDDYSYQYPHDIKFTERTRQDLEEAARKDGPGSAPNGSTSYHHTTNGRSVLTPSQSSHYALVCDYTSRFCGHCNTHTDIKEAIFLGDRNNYIAAGSDDGNIFIWDRSSTNLVRVLRGDSSIVNCVQWHPTTCMMASSGIENVVRLWEPWKDDSELGADTRVVSDLIKVSKENQHRMGVDPFEVMLMRMGFRLAMAEGAAASEDHQHLHVNDEEGQEAGPLGARGRGGEDNEGERGGEGREGNDLGWIENPANCRQS